VVAEFLFALLFFLCGDPLSVFFNSLESTERELRFPMPTALNSLFPSRLSFFPQCHAPSCTPQPAILSQSPVPLSHAPALLPPLFFFGSPQFPALPCLLPRSHRGLKRKRLLDLLLQSPFDLTPPRQLCRLLLLEHSGSTAR